MTPTIQRIRELFAAPRRLNTTIIFDEADRLRDNRRPPRTPFSQRWGEIRTARKRQGHKNHSFDEFGENDEDVDNGEKCARGERPE